MKVSDIMTKDVISVKPTTSVHEAARTLVEHRISGVPVVDDAGRVVGLLTEGDLILRHKPREHAPWWRAFFSDGEELAREYQKAVGMTVAEVMTRSVISVAPDLPVEAVATILDEHRIRRVPVVAEGRLVGVVSRGDLVRALASGPERAAVSRADADLVREMKARLARERWVVSRGIVVQAEDGVLSLWGIAETETEKAAIETMARAIEGVKGVKSYLVVETHVAYHYGI
jgi:CBS domain-containing protein